MNDNRLYIMKDFTYRFCHWGYLETPETFRRWYESIDYQYPYKG